MAPVFSLPLDPDDLPTSDSIQERVNARYDKLFYTSADGTRKPHVCVVCDEFLTTEEDMNRTTVQAIGKMKDVLSWDNIPDPRRKKGIEDHYSVSDELKTKYPKLDGMALSPRAFVRPGGGRGKQPHFLCCKRCSGCVQKKKLPRHAIVNKNYVGAAPDCLKELTQVELAFLSPVKHYGFCITWTGGKQQNLKGTLSFMRVEKRRIAKSLATLDDLGFNDHVLILYSGRMTPWQKENAEKESKIRVDKILIALKWLCENNCKWEGVVYDDIVKQLKTKEPVVCDRSEEVAGENANIEEQKLFTVFYPDGATTPTHGGFDEPDGFKKYVSEMAEEGYNIEFQADLEEKYVKGDDRDLLIDSCLLQFPYGIGGLHERRTLQDGSKTTKSDLQEYLYHLSLMSQPEFHKPLFQLVQYSILSKFRLLKSSRLQLRGKTDAENLASGLNTKDVISCINGRRLKNKSQGTIPSKKFLDAVDATAKNLPHTNEAAQQARGKGEAMQHHFGMSSLFVTATFDDENSLVMQVYSGLQLDDDTKVEQLSDADLTARAKTRRELRLTLPGIAALNFEMLFDIFMEEVIGWDVVNHKPSGKEGFFGLAEALSFAIEEQGRKTLHVHMTVWIQGYKDLQNDFFYGNRERKAAAKDTLVQYSEHVSSTKLMPDPHEQGKSKVRIAFDHECPVAKRSRSCPEVVTDQELRNLRNKRGYKDMEGRFAYCPHEECSKVWTYEDMVCDFMRNCQGICHQTQTGAPILDRRLSQAGGAGSSTVPRARMFGKVLEYQKGLIPAPVASINAVYQHHISCHVTGCFKCQKKGNKKRGHVCGPSCECRYHLPDKKRARADILVEDSTIDWYKWDGSCIQQPLAQIIPKRGKYDLFQNVSCNAVSHSRLSCNNNVSLILDGPIGQYMHKYQEKENQAEEAADYKEVESIIKRFGEDRTHDNDRSEALRRICRAAFAHNKRNVISPCFAAYLTRHDSRFYYSHEFKYCYLKDVVRLHNKEEIRGTLKFTPDGNSFFENSAIDYLCRNDSLEDVSLAEFTEVYYVGNMPQKIDDDDEIYPFKSSTASYCHPSVLKSGVRKGQCSRGVFKREEPVLMRISQWMFPDTATFKDNIFTCMANYFNNHMEEYAQLVLSLFVPHRCAADLKIDGNYPYLRKLREIYHSEQRLLPKDKVVFSERNTSFLQNLQNCRSNTLRYKIKNDALMKETEPYQSINPETGEPISDDEEEEVDEANYELFAELLNDEQDQPSSTTDSDPEFLPKELNKFDFSYMKDMGKDSCGYKGDIPPIKLQEDRDYSEFVKTTSATQQGRTNPGDSSATTRKKYSCNEIVAVHLKKNLQKLPKQVFTDKTINVTNATGSVKSIREWGKASFGTDRKQQRAFEILISSFLLTFYDEKPEDKFDPTTEASRTRSKYRQAHNALKRLRGDEVSNNLVCLLHGPGGSGKSTVINTVKAYARDYCAMLNHTFTSRTIIITAMSGVAATLLHGETAHSVLGLNRDTIQNEESEAWVDARLLIVDECSFASESDFCKMFENLKTFMQHRFGIYGGLNTVFAGDYSQLEPVNRDPIYKDYNYCPEFHGSLNCYIELDGKWRFRNDPDWGDMMTRFREGNPTSEDIHLINDECLVEHKPAPAGIQVASYTNKDRDAVNASVFDDFTFANKPADGSVLEAACLVFMDDLYMNNSSKTPVPVTSNSVKKHFYQFCTENECSYKKNSKQGRIDPVLKLYVDAPMMLTQNNDVKNGQANGSRVFVKGISVKTGEKPFVLELANGVKVKALFASQVKSITVEHECDTISPRQFQVTSDTFNFLTKMELGGEDLFITMKGTQFPIISNSCTTGHKLQGCSLDAILANDWFYGANWAYVVLSRVRSMKGLYMRKKLSLQLTKYEKPAAMKKMIQGFREKSWAMYMISEEEYERLERVEPVAMPRGGVAARGSGPADDSAMSF